MRVLLALALACGAALAAPAPADRYSMADFAHVPKIDVHLHLHGTLDRFVERMRADDFKGLTINVDYADFPPLADQRAQAIALARKYPGEIAWVSSFDARGFESPGWTERTLAQIEEARAAGAVGVKIWKNVGMSVRDHEGKLLMLDDPRLDPLFKGLAATHTVVLGHQAEPKNCWLPADQMTTAGDREYFSHHPQYWMYKHPEMPTHEAQLAARDRRLEHDPGLGFVGLHLASLEADVDALARFLDHFPDATVDVAARMVHLQQASVANRDKVRAFVLRYQDRLMYGTDVAHVAPQSDAEFAAEAHAAWRADWRYLVTDEVLHSPEFPGAFRSLDLPREVVDKIYRLNALRRFPGAWDATIHAPATKQP